jgi:hypothetical protein
MSGRAWVNAGLAAVLACLGALAWLSSGTEPAPAPLTDVTAERIDAILIERERQEAIRLESRGGGWRMVAPVDAPANEVKVQALLQVLHAPSTGQLDPRAHAPARFGLEPPKARLHMSGAGVDLELAFGDAHPLDARRYVLHAGLIHLLPDTTYHHLIAAAADYARREPPAADPSLETVSGETAAE